MHFIETQLVCDMALMILSLLFFYSSQLIFGLALTFLYFLELLLKIFISTNSLLLIILITIKRLVVSCLLIMVLFLLKTDPVSLIDNGLLQILQTYLKSLFIPSEEGKHSIADFIKGFCRPMSYVGRYDSFLYVAIRLLLDAGADPNILDVNGETCLHLLARHPSLWVRINCSKLLKEAGADLTIANCHGESFYCDQGWVWTTAPKKLTCSAALQVPQLLRHSKRLLAAQNIPKHLVPFVLEHHRSNDHSVVYFDKFFRNLDAWFAQVGKQRTLLRFLTNTIITVFGFVIFTLVLLFIWYSPTIIVNLAWLGLLF